MLDISFYLINIPQSSKKRLFYYCYPTFRTDSAHFFNCPFWTFGLTPHSWGENCPPLYHPLFENEQFRSPTKIYFIDNHLFINWHQYWHRLIK